MGDHFCFLIFSPLEFKNVGILCQYLNDSFSIRNFWLQLHPECPRISSMGPPVRHILLIFFTFSPDGIHQTLHCRIQYLCTMLFHCSNLHWIIRYSWKQPHCLIHQSKSERNPGVAVIWSLNRILAFIEISQRTLCLVLYGWNLSTVQKPHAQYESLLLLHGFYLDNKVQCVTSWILNRYSCCSILLFRSWWQWIGFSVSNMFTTLKSIP